MGLWLWIGKLSSFKWLFDSSMVGGGNLCVISNCEVYFKLS